jgi:hypothetical protein
MSVRERSVMVAAICCKLDAMAWCSCGSSRPLPEVEVVVGVRRYQIMSARDSIGAAIANDVAWTACDESESTRVNI